MRTRLLEIKTSLALAALLLLGSASVAAQSYTYLSEGFEEDAWQASGTTVTSSTGQWTTNKNVASTEQVYDGTYSLKISKKAGLTSPELTEGAGTLIYYGHVTNRTVSVETSADGTTWTTLSSEKITSDWTKYIVFINDADVRYVRLATTSNNQFYVDDIIITKPDGTDGDGNSISVTQQLPYFTQTFEDTSYFPQSSTEASTETTYTIDGQGEWICYNVFAATNESYITDGSAHDLRMLKSGSYVISPVLSQGVVSITFNEGRTDRDLTIYTSTDGGTTWTLLRTIATETENTVNVLDRDVNRVKIANEDSGDADLDNLSINAYPEGTAATMNTPEVSGVGPTTATLTVSVATTGDKDISEKGICYSTTNTTPTIDDNTVLAADDGTATITALAASTTVYARSYAVSLAGIGYSDVVSFTTSDAVAPAVTTADAADDDYTDEVNVYMLLSGTITDNGGEEVTEAGFVISEQQGFATDDSSLRTETVTRITNGAFSASLPFETGKTYYFRAYATNAVGTSYGEEKSLSTVDAAVPTFAHNVYYVSVDGDDTAGGTIDAPFKTLQTAVDKVVAGDTIYIYAGTHSYTERINISTVGSAGSGQIVMKALDGRAILDFSSMKVADANQGIRLTGSYWYIYGIDICGAGDNGLLIERNKPSGGTYSDIVGNTEQGHDNVIENCAFYRNRDTGLQMKNLAEYNKVINCDAYFNADPDMGDADGFAVKISHGTGNYFYGCRAWNNSDDGWDQYIKSDGGFPDDVTTTLENCWAFNNGFLEDGTAGEGNGNGFKLGSDEGRNNVILNRCLAFENLQKGFDQNHNTGSMIFNNCSGYAAPYLSNSSHYTYRVEENVASGKEIRFTNCVAVSDGVSDRKESEYAPVSVSGTQITCNFACPASYFKSIDTTDTDGERGEDGSLPVLDFMRIADGNTVLIDAGTAVSAYTDESAWAEGILYNGSAPDLGCFETADATAIRSVTASARQTGRISVVATSGGMAIISVEGVETNADLQVVVADASGRTIDAHAFQGTTTAVNLRHASAGLAIIHVSGSGVNETAKVMVR